MKKQRLPKGWTQEQIRALAQHHDQLTPAEQAAEIDAALGPQKGHTVMVVPTELVPEIVKLIAKKQPA